LSLEQATNGLTTIANGDAHGKIVIKISEPRAHLPATYAGLWPATPSGGDWVPANLIEA
jgi:hypothetical protein